MTTTRTATRPHGRLTRDHSRQAAAAGWAARKRQAASLQRALPASRDDDLVRTSVSTALVRQAAAIIDRDPDLVSWIEEEVLAAQAGPGRPSRLSIRTALICFWLQHVAVRNSHLINLPALLANLTPAARRELGVDYLDARGRPCQVSYHQLLRAFHNIATAFDPFAEGDDELDELEARRRAANLQTFSLRMVRASVADRAHAGNYAVDATLVWAWNRPPGSLKGKVERRGRDGDLGSPLSLSEVLGGGGDGDLDLARAGLVDDPIGAILEEERSSPTTTKKKRRPHQGAAWVGRGKNKSKSVFGYAMHTVMVTGPNAPAVIEALAVTPAPAHPAKATVPLLRALHDARSADPELAEVLAAGAAAAIGQVVADPAYSPNVADWQLPIRALGGSATFRLHRTNQAGRRAVRGTTFVDGRPHCDCLPDHLATLAYPKFPYDRSALDAYQAQVVRRAPFEMKANGGYRSNGGRQFLSPHFDAATKSGGCEHCVDAHGNAVVDPVTGLAKVRCCTQRTKSFTGTELGLYQDAPFGTPAWERLWNPRNLVEGGYGMLKGLALVNWGHDYHHFTGLARETVVATFAVMAYNFHVQRTFDARARLTAEPARPTDLLPSAQPTETLPGSIAAAERAAAAEAREASPRGPKGLEVLGTPRRSGP